MNAKHEEGLSAAAAPGSGGCGLHQHHIHIGAPWILGGLNRRVLLNYVGFYAVRSPLP